MTTLHYRDPGTGKFVEVAAGGGGTSAPEVAVGTATPAGAEVLWVDPSGTPPVADTGSYVKGATEQGLKVYRVTANLGDVAGGGTSVESTVDLTPAGFTAPPTVMVTGGTPFNSVTWAFSVRGITATSVTIRGQGAAFPGPASFGVYVLAIGV